MRALLLPLGLAALLGTPVPSPAQASPSQATVLTLEQALEQASTHSLILAAAAKEVEAAEGAVRQAGVLRNPQLNASVEDTRRDMRTTTATLDIPLELGGKRSARVAAAERARDVAQAELAQARVEVRNSVITAYFAVLLAQERVRLAGSSADVATHAADAIAKRVIAGKVSPVDETRARVDQANAQLEVSEAQAQLHAARQALSTLWGDIEPTFSRVAGDIDAAPQRPALGQLLRQLDASPGLLTSRLKLDRRRALVDVERSKARPDLTLSVGAKRDNDLGRTQAVVGVSIPLPLFDRNQGAVYEAIQRAGKASDELQASRLPLIAEIQQTSNQLSVARTALEVLQTTVLPAALQAYEAASKGFEAGKFGFFDVIDAQRALLQARTRYLAALTSAHQAAAAIDRVLGR